jgi:high-affinity K+ transport system ATPase subunit B
MQRMADKVSFWFVLAVFAVALATFFGWGFFGPDPSWTYAVVNSVAVLIIACPCALGLATPMSIMVATGRAAQAGVLFRDAEAIERLRTIDTLIVDKTGTLTRVDRRSVRSLRWLISRRMRFCGLRPASTRAASIRWLTRSSRRRVGVDWRCRPRRNSNRQPA